MARFVRCCPKYTATSTFDPRWLRTGRVTIYLVLPADKLETLPPLAAVDRRYLCGPSRGANHPRRNPVLFLLDEAAHLGKIRVLETAVTLMRGMGIRLWFFFQSINQLKERYGDKAKTILDNIDTQQYFGVNSFEAAEEISKSIGDTTIPSSRVARIPAIRGNERNGPEFEQRFERPEFQLFRYGAADCSSPRVDGATRGCGVGLPSQFARHSGPAHQVLRPSRLPGRRHGQSTGPWAEGNPAAAVLLVVFLVIGAIAALRSVREWAVATAGYNGRVQSNAREWAVRPAGSIYPPSVKRRAVASAWRPSQTYPPSVKR